jgi:hypothetical protein
VWLRLIWEQSDTFVTRLKIYVDSRNGVCHSFLVVQKGLAMQSTSNTYPIDGDYSEVWGMRGIVPRNSKPVTRLA